MRRTRSRQHARESTPSALAHATATAAFVFMATSTSTPTAISDARHEYGKASMQRDRMLQQASTREEAWARNKLLIKRTQQRVVKLRKNLGRPTTMRDVCIWLYLCSTYCSSCTLIIHCVACFYRQVYELLDEKFSECPWPVPPWAILNYLPIPEQPGVATSEALLRKMKGQDKRYLLTSRWEFIKSPRPKWTYVHLLQ